MNMPQERSSASSHDSLAETSVLRLAIGDRVDLESCPYLGHHPMAQFEYGVVAHLERETPECLVVGYEGIDLIGYPVDGVLRVVQPSVAPLQ